MSNASDYKGLKSETIAKNQISGDARNACRSTESLNSLDIASISVYHQQISHFGNISLSSSQGLTARRDPANKVCYVSKLDPSFSVPGEIRQEMDHVSFIQWRLVSSCNEFSINNC